VNSLELFVPGTPVSWARPVHVKGRVHNPKKQSDAKARLQRYIRLVWGHQPPIPKGEAVSVFVRFTFPTKKKREIGTPKASRPDIDNLAKQVLDALQGSHAPLVIEDDGQIASISCQKVYGDEPGTFIRVTRE
jgi:Holliday junction resolvase RusA-like endonuclease